jgi:hypothetical protein
VEYLSCGKHLDFASVNPGSGIPVPVVPDLPKEQMLGLHDLGIGES